MNRWLSLGVVLPVIISVFALLIITLSFFSTRSTILQDVIEYKTNDTRDRLNFIQGAFEQFIRADKIENVKQMVASFSSEPDLISFFATSNSDIVIASNSYANLGLNWHNLDLQPDPSHVKQVIDRQSTEVFPAHNDKWLDGYSSLCADSGVQRLRINNCGFIFYRINMGYHYDRAIHRLRQITVFTTAGTLIGLIVLLLVINFLFSKRTGELVKTLKNFAAGDRTIRADCWGNDELTWLGRSINEMFEVIEQSDIKLQQVNKQLEISATTDSLTGIANRRQFDHMLVEELSRATRTTSPMTLILCDVDYFKKYNDTYGHQAGDACLQKIASVMKRVFKRSGDLPARYGGEEFAVILPNTDKNDAKRLAQSLIVAVRELGIPHEASSVDSNVTISIGCTTYDNCSKKPPSPENLIRSADEALYKAKANGRNKIEYAEEEKLLIHTIV